MLCSFGSKSSSSVERSGVIWVRVCPSLLSFAVNKTLTKSNLGLGLTSHNPSQREVIIGTQGRKLEAGPEASVRGQGGVESFASLPSIVHAVGFLCNPGHPPRANITPGVLGPPTSTNYEPRK